MRHSPGKRLAQNDSASNSETRAVPRNPVEHDDPRAMFSVALNSLSSFDRSPRWKYEDERYPASDELERIQTSIILKFSKARGDRLQHVGKLVSDVSSLALGS